MPTELDDDRNPCEAAPAAVPQQLPPGIVPGSLVTARDDTWRVVTCAAYEDCGEVLLRGSGDERVLLWPFDRLRPVQRKRRLRRVSKRRWARAIAVLIRESHSPGRLMATSATAAILPYQLDPAVRVAAGASGVLLADEVGLGKTVQAGWIVADVLARDREARILVCAPPGLLAQWRDELRRFFEVDCTVVDARWVRRCVASLPADVSPWCLPGVYVASVDFIKRPDVSDAVARHLWDVLIVDEAHGASAPTERHAALTILSKSARRVVLITATPFAGDESSFQSLMALAAADRGSVPIFRRSRSDVGAGSHRRHRFQLVHLSAAETRLQRTLERYTAEVWRKTTRDAPARLAMAVLRKRALSSPAAAARSLRRRAALLAARDPAPQQLGLFAPSDDEAHDEEPLEALAAPGLDEVERERKWLAALADLADNAAGADGKRRFLARLLSRVGDNAAIVFTEYRDTLKDLARDYPSALHLHGGMPRQERDAVQRRFNAEGGVLLATDAAAEGLNLHGRCRLVVNYELPWNPARLEQRIGRVDRIGQVRAVHAISLVARDSAEDLVVSALLRRLERIARTLGARDRLAAFLDEARIAQLVIGGAPLGDIQPDPFPAPGLVSSVSTEAFQAANRLETIRRVDGGSARAYDEDVVVCRLRGSRVLDAGTVFVFKWRAVAGPASVRAAEAIAIHVRKDIDPRELPALRLVACLARERAEGLLADARSRQHSIDAERSTRERSLLATPKLTPDSQLRLFGRHVLDDASEGPGQQRIDAHRRSLAMLDDDLKLHSELQLAGVLFVGAALRPA